MNTLGIPTFSAATARRAPVARAAASDDVIELERIIVPQVSFGIGAKYDWHTGQTTRFDECGHGALQKALGDPKARAAKKRGAKRSMSMTVHETKGGAPRLFKVTGATAAPDVLVVGPDRRVVRTSGQGFAIPGWLVYKDHVTKTTYVEAAKPPAGQWSFVAAAGSSALTRLETRAAESIPEVVAALGYLKRDPRAGRSPARGSSGWVLRVNVREKAPGTKVALYEVDDTGRRVLLVPDAPAGSRTYPWIPSAELAGSRRTIVAESSDAIGLIASEKKYVVNVAGLPAVKIEAAAKPKQTPPNKKRKTTRKG